MKRNPFIILELRADNIMYKKKLQSFFLYTRTLWYFVQFHFRWLDIIHCVCSQVKEHFVMYFVQIDFNILKKTFQIDAARTVVQTNSILGNITNLTYLFGHAINGILCLITVFVAKRMIYSIKINQTKSYSYTFKIYHSHIPVTNQYTYLFIKRLGQLTQKPSKKIYCRLHSR